MKLLLSIRFFWGLLTLLVLCAPANGVAAPADSRPHAGDKTFHFEFIEDLRATGWRVHTPRGKAAAEFTVAESGTLSVKARAGVSFFYIDIPQAFETADRLRWQWRVDQDFPATDLSVPGADDRPLALHVYFDNAKPRLMSRMVGLFGLPAGGDVITYIWGGAGPAGTTLANPFMKEGTGTLVILRASDPGRIPQWINAEVDLAADYRRIFGRPPPRVRGLAISSDTDDTGATARASIRKLTLGHGSAQP